MARRLTREDRRLVGRSGVARARPVGASLAEHQPPHGDRLLGVAHTARIRQPQLRDRGGRRHPPLRQDEPVRARAGLAARVRATVRRRRGGARLGARGLPRPAAFRARLRARVFAGPVGARRGSRGLYGSVLLTGLRFHRHRQRLRHRPHRARCAPGGRGGARRGVQRHLPASIRRVHSAVRRAVPHHGQRPSDDGESVVGQRVLLGDDGPVVLSAAVPSAGIHRVDRADAAALLPPARAHAAVPQRVGLRRRREQLRAHGDQRHRRRVPAPAAGHARRSDR